MKGKYKTTLNVFVNIVLLILIISITYSWMLTEPGEAEIVDYERQLVITSSAVSVDVYAYTGGQYVEQTTSPMQLGLLAPGVLQRYRFDITNSNDTMASTKIVFSDITGDITELEEFVIFGSTSPTNFNYTMDTKLKQNATDNTYYVDFIEEVQVPANTTLSLYWYVSISNNATNEIGDKELSIDNIAFIKP